MAVSTIHRLDKIVFPSAVEFTQVHNARWQAGITDMIERPAGHLHPMFVANQEQKPVLEFTTSQLAVLLGAVGVGGTSYAASAINTYFKLATATGSVARATTSHKRVAITNSTVHWTSIRLPHNGRGEATVMVTAVYDGTNAPFIYTGSVALSGNLTASTYFGAGPVGINNSNVPGIKEITIDSGVRLLQEGSSSEPWDTFVGIETTEPIVTIRTLEAVNWNTLGLAGLALDGTDGLEFYARKYAANGARVADATAEHIFFKGALGKAQPVDSNGENVGPISDTLRCVLVSASDSVAPLIGTVSSAIT